MYTRYILSIINSIQYSRFLYIRYRTQYLSGKYKIVPIIISVYIITPIKQ